MDRAWISPEIFEWSSFSEGGRIVDPSDWTKPYRHFGNADQSEHDLETEYGRVNSICALKRAIDSRLRHINELYKLRSIPSFAKADGQIDRLVAAGVIRPLLVSKLNQIRNRVEHSDDPPPNKATCQELIDFTWYFLKSTDQFVRTVGRGITLTPTEEDPVSPQFNYQCGPFNDWHVDADCWLSGAYYSAIPKVGWIELITSAYFTREEVLDRLSKLNPTDDMGQFFNRSAITTTSYRSADSLRIEGRVVPEKSTYRRFLTTYFAPDR